MALERDALNTVRRYLREPIEAGRHVRPAARRLTDARRQEARTLYEGPAGGNARRNPTQRPAAN